MTLKTSMKYTGAYDTMDRSYDYGSKTLKLSRYAQYSLPALTWFKLILINNNISLNFKVSIGSIVHLAFETCTIIREKGITDFI